MTRRVLLTDGAARDLDEWYAAAYARGGPAAASRALDLIEQVVGRLAAGDVRDEPLPQLRELGITAERQVVTSDGLRVVYRASGDSVVVVLMAPVARSFQSLLQRRLLDA
ncbi:MAG TPA: type II toxin-antitoxin system RelE/ParE family toxin [Trueperaceae bacterium]